MLEWIQDYMVSHYGLKEIWLGDEYPSTPEVPKKVTGDASSAANGADGESKDHPAPIHWDKPTRSGVYTVKESEVPRVSAQAMQRHAKVNIFISENFYTADRVLIIVQGSGAVRPGQWARALCINHSLKSGTIFDYLDIARECNLGVIVLNPNQDRIRLRVTSAEHPNGSFHSDHVYPILGHEDHTKHIVHVYDNFIAKTAAKDLFMVAHSRGGDSALQLLNNRLEYNLIEKSVHKLITEKPTEEQLEEARRAAKIEPKVGTITADEAEAIRRREEEGVESTEDGAAADADAAAEDNGDETDLKKRLRALAFTDSVHWAGGAASSDVADWLKANAKDWVASKEPLDTPIPENRENAGCECVSAGHTKHEWTSPCAVNSVFEFFFSTIDNPPHFAPRQIPFSHPPQHMPSTEFNVAGSWAEVASRNPGKASTETSPTSTHKDSETTTPARPATIAAAAAAAAEDRKQQPAGPTKDATHPSYAAVAAGKVHPQGAPPTAPKADSAHKHSHQNPENAPAPPSPQEEDQTKPSAASPSTNATAVPTTTPINNTNNTTSSKPTSTPKPSETPKKRPVDEEEESGWGQTILVAGLAIAAAAAAAYFIFRRPTVRVVKRDLRR